MRPVVVRSIAVPSVYREADDRPARGKSVHLYPGELFASSEGHLISTVLGSCVSVFLFDSIRRAGGANHFLLPHWIGGDLSSPRFGNAAMEQLLERLQAIGCEMGGLTANVFGGASVFRSPTAEGSIGQKNVRVAKRFLEERHIPVVGESIGGSRGRKIIVDTGSGDVWVKAL